MLCVFMREYSGTDMESHYAARSRSYVLSLLRHNTLNINLPKASHLPTDALFITLGRV
jgi:hypothetical protein